MSARYALPAIAALLAASCLVPIDDVERNRTASGGSAGSIDASSGGAATGGAGGGASGSGAAAGNAATSGASGKAGAAGSTGSSGGSGASGSSGAAGSGGSSGASCLLPLSDDFGDGAFAPLWYWSAENGMQVAETAGVLRFTFPITPLGIAYAGIYSSKTDYDITSCSVIVRVVELPNSSTDGYIHFAVDATNSNAFEYNLSGGKIDAQLWLAGSGNDLKSEPFSASKHSFLRLSESAGKLVWETSGDGQNWLPFASAAAPFSVSSVWITIGAGMYKLESSSPGTGAFDDLNRPP